MTAQRVCGVADLEQDTPLRVEPDGVAITVIKDGDGVIRSKIGSRPTGTSVEVSGSKTPCTLAALSRLRTHVSDIASEAIDPVDELAGRPAEAPGSSARV